MLAVSSILADLFILFAAAKVAGILFAWLKQPAVIGELLVGVLIGPFAVGLVGTPDPALVQVFHGDSTSAREGLALVLEVMAELGVVVLLFFVGLETRLSDLLGVGLRAALVGALGVLVPFVGGYTIMALGGTGVTESLFVAVALVATSVGITARVLRDLGVLESNEARVILGAAVIDDVLAMILLAVVSGLGARGEFNLLDIGLIAAQAVAFTIFVALVGTRAVGHLKGRVDWLSIEHGPLVVALALMLGLATAAAAVGLAPIIGAFLAGMVLAEAGEQYEIDKDAVPIYEFLVPFFFVITGTRVNPALFLDPSIAGAALLITAVAIAAKLLGAGAGALGMGRRSALIVGVGMIPRGEVGLIIAGLGLALGVVSPELFSAVVVMSIVTTLLVPPILAWLYRFQKRKPVEVSNGLGSEGARGKTRERGDPGS